MTEATPMTTPISVSTVRSLLVQSACSAMRNASVLSIGEGWLSVYAGVETRVRCVLRNRRCGGSFPEWKAFFLPALPRSALRRGVQGVQLRGEGGFGLE